MKIVINSAKKLGGGATSYSSVESVLDCRKRLVNPFIRVAVVVITAISLALAFSCTAPEDDLDGGGSSKPSGLYTVIFDPAGGSFDGSNEALEVKTDSNNRAKVPAEPTKEGFSFSGWHLEDNINSPDFTNATVVSTDMTVYAVWSGEAIKVTFKVRDAEGEYVEHSSAFLTHPKDTVDAIPEPVYDGGDGEDVGFVFQGWYTSEQENILITDMDLVNSGDPAGFSREVPATGKFELGKTKVTQKIDVYGLWQERPENSIMVSFEPYPGNVVQNSFALSFYDYRLPHTVTFPTVTRPYYTASEGGKWFMADNSTEFTKNSAEGAEDGTQLTKTGSGSEDDITVHQKWSFDGYIITFNSHFGENPGNITVTTDGAAIGSLPTPAARTGYAFKGWFSQEDGGGTPITAATVPNCAMTAHASWERIIIIFDSMLGSIGGTTANPQSAEVSTSTGKLDALPTKPKKGGYAFMGWYSNNDGTGVKLEATAAISASATYYAKWFAPADITTANAAASATSNGTAERSYVATADGVDEVHIFKTSGNDKTLTSTLTVSRAPAASSVKVFIVAGGGGGGAAGSTFSAFGGGAGGVVLNNAVTFTASAYTITVGRGAPGGSINAPSDTIDAKKNAIKNTYNGTNSSITGSSFTATAKGGGGGGWHFSANASGGADGGSGGGGLGSGFGDCGSGTTGQGKNGHTGGNAGGGGYNSAGTATAGGAGLDNPWTDIANGVPAITIPAGFAGGGSGGGVANATHGGGHASSTESERNGVPHTGGGGNGGAGGNGRAGGSGIVMVRWQYIGD